VADATESPAEPAPRPPEPPQQSGPERPRFLLKFPDHPELNRLVRAFELGNYAEVRRAAPALLDDENQAIRRGARELLKRIDPDPLMKYLLMLAVSLFVLVVWYTYGNRAH
jgi:hypothetical protein